MGRDWDASMVRTTFAATLLLIAGCGGGLPPVDRAELIGERFQTELDRRWQAAQETEENFPGATAAFALADGRVFAFATGFSDVENEVAMTTDLRMPSGSIGKTYVAAVGLALAAEGRLDLDEPISSWVGEEDWFSRLPNGEDLTLRILLSHSGGLIDHAFQSEDFIVAVREDLASDDPDAYLKPRELLEFALDQEPLFAAGEGFSYTDTGYILAGMVMEAVTGEAYYAHLRRIFLDPLSFELTLAADRRDLPDLAQGYAHESAEIFGTPLRMVDEGGLVFNPLTEWTGGGLVNNPQDLVRWAQVLYEGRALEVDYLGELLAPGFVADPERPAEGYGLGVRVRDSDGHGLVFGHGGFYPGYNSQLVYFPDSGVAIALQINSDKSEIGDHTMALAQLVLDGLEGETSDAD